jgi:DNA primase
MTRIDWADLRARHRLVDVIRRSGVEIPFDAGDATISCPLPRHDDTTPSMVVHLDTDRYHCFGCGAHGDVIQWACDLYQVGAVEAARLLDADHLPYAVSARHPAGVEPTGHGQALRARAERPDLGRTPPHRVEAALDAAWAYLTLPALHQRGVGYLTDRHIDVTAIEGAANRAVVGHTPAGVDQLTVHLVSCGFSTDELVDSSLTWRHSDGRCIDFFRRRVLLPIHGADGQLVGIVGRTTANGQGPKYLNMSRTHTYDKSAVLYRPSVHPLDRHASVVVCEGTLDALAIAAQAAASGLSKQYGPVAPSGLALSDTQLLAILALHPTPPVLSGDGDDAGRRATIEWATRTALHGRESAVTVWPDGHDPASWIAAHGEAGLLAVTRKGCLHPAAGDLRPRHAGEVIAQAALDDLASGRYTHEQAVTAIVAPRTHLDGPAARRYTQAASAVLSGHGPPRPDHPAGPAYLSLGSDPEPNRPAL